MKKTVQSFTLQWQLVIALFMTGSLCLSSFIVVKRTPITAAHRFAFSTNTTSFLNASIALFASENADRQRLAVGSTNAVPTLSINDVSLSERNSGTTIFSFTVSLSSPAEAGGVTFDIATANGGAIAPGDYTAQSLTNQSIPEGSSTYVFSVSVNGDGTPEPNETFLVNVTNVSGATVADGQGQGTILNDDVTLTPIHDIQGPGNSSPIVGSSVTTRGIVTGVKSNGFFIQEPDASVDADPATSEGIYVFTSSTPPTAAAVGAQVQVTGTVSEFVPAADQLQPPLTELISPTVLQLSTGNSLPAAIPLTASFPSPAGPFDQLERLEGMRVSVASLNVVAPTQGVVDEANATATSNGVFYGVVTSVARPFREAGIQAPDPAPSGTIPPIPRFDANPELIRIDSDGLTGSLPIDVSTEAVVTGLIGPLEYNFRAYTILPEPGASIGVTGGMTLVPVPDKTSEQFTVGSISLQRFFDTVSDPGISDPVLTTTAFNNRLNKASLMIRNVLKTPDILAVVEVENLTTLQALTAKISADAIAASQPDPQYAAYLVEGNDIGGIDVGFLVKTMPVSGGTPTVNVLEVQQELAGTLFVNPDASTVILNDRPPLRLKADVNDAAGRSSRITVIVNHLRSLNGVNDIGIGPNNWATDGARVRAKRQKQAEDLANLVQARQIADPTERIILVGDFNTFEVNDGFVDVLGVIKGTPTPDNQTSVPGDGVDLVNPNLIRAQPTLPGQQYSYVSDGNAQTLDHLLYSTNLSSVFSQVVYAHANADYPETARNNPNVPERLTDHDAVVGYFLIAPFSATLAGSSTICSGQPTTLAVTVTNGTGPYSLTISDGTTTTAIANYSSGQSIMVSPAVSTTYTIIALTDASNVSISTSNLSGTAIVTVSSGGVVSAANLMYIPDPGLCQGRLTATATGSAFIFTGPNGYVFSNVYRNPGTYQAFALDVKAAGTYTLTVSGGPGCATASYTITVADLCR